MSSQNGLIKVENINPDEQREIFFLYRCPTEMTKNLIEMAFYCKSDNEIGQCVGVTFEHKVVGNIARKVNVLPAPVGSSKRVLQGKYLEKFERKIFDFFKVSTLLRKPVK